MGNRLIRRARKDAVEKIVRALVLRCRELTRYRREEDRERVALEKPVFWGYRRKLVLRKDAATRKDANRLLELLRIVQKEEDCKRKDFKRWDKQTRKWGDWNHTPRKLRLFEFRKLPDDLKCYFEEYQHPIDGSRFRIRNPHWFESRRSKLYLTHRFLPNVEREIEASYLDAKMEEGQLWAVYSKIKSRKARWKTWSKGLEIQKIFSSRHLLEIKEAIIIHASGQLDQERGKEVNQDAKT